ncbi:MAG: helix-turn-helix domain-containing protein, partial [Pseudomonadota bacterium]
SRKGVRFKYSLEGIKMNNGHRHGEAVDWHAFTARRLVAGEFGVSEEELMAPTRARAEIAFTRQVAMYLAHVVYQLSYNEVAEAFDRERTTVAYACAVVEDARDDPSLDTRMEKLEVRLRHLDRLREGRRIHRCGRLASILEDRKAG